MGWWRGDGVRSVCAELGLVVARFRTGTRLARLTTCFGVPAQDGNMRDRDEANGARAVRQRRECHGGDTLEDPQLGETPEEAETRAQDEAAAVAGMQGLLQAPTQGVKQMGDDLSTVKLYVVSKGKGGATKDDMCRELARCCDFDVALAYLPVEAGGKTVFLLQAPTAEAQRLVAHDFECIDVLTEGEAHQRSSILVGLGGVNILRIATSLFPREQGHGVKMDSELFMHAGGEGIRVLAD